MQAQLQSRIDELLCNFPGSQSLDSPNFAKFPGERADFLIDERFIVEVKNLEVDPKGKIEAYVQELRSRSDFPSFYGEVDLRGLLNQLPDGEAQYRRIFGRVSRGIEAIVRKANSQIRNTAEVLKIDQPVGVLIIANEDIPLLNPRLMVKKASATLCERTTTGSIKHKSIDHLWLISQTHHLHTENGQIGIPSIIVDGPGATPSPAGDKLFQELQKRWAAQNGLPLQQLSGVGDVAELDFQALNHDGSKIGIN